MAEKQNSNKTQSAKGDAWVKGVNDLMDALQDTAVSEVEIRFGDTAVFLRRRPGIVPQAPVAEAPSSAEEPVSRTAIQAPLNGIYYDRSSPEADPFVQVGDHIEAGQVVALIEAMKVFNEVHADQSGRVTALLVESGDMVQSGQDLIALDVEGEKPSGSQP
ncbi:MAG: acetyl-CoA carboxylase [Chloroflexota bacterium]|nr:acetyl-CoA carboxylase [Chloroflexota bacterium]MDE2931605.1 acetyl-CoA carboxylase [Chloroflexota bacterium]